MVNMKLPNKTTSEEKVDGVTKRLIEVAKEINEEPSVLLNEYNSFVKQFIDEGIEEEKARNVAAMKVIGAYRRAIKSNAVLFKGFFFAVEPKKNSVSYIRSEAKNRLKQYKDTYGKDWKTEAIANGIINEKEELLYNKTNASWPNQYGKPIPDAVWKKTAYGIFEMPDTGELKYCRVFISDPDNFYPELLRIYTFRAKCKDTGVDSPNITALPGITVLNPTDEVITYEEFEAYAEEFLSDKCMSLSDVVSGNKLLIDRVDIVLSEAIINRITIPENREYYFVDFSDINSIDINNELSVTGDIYYVEKMAEQAVGIVAYNVYQSGDKVKGRICGFIPNPAFSKPEDIYEIGEDVVVVEEDEFS